MRGGALRAAFALLALALSTPLASAAGPAPVLSAASKPKNVAPSKDPFLLRPGGRGEVCLECHSDFETILQRAFIHTPVRTKKCAGCHAPHVAQRPKLLADEPGRICERCHDVVPAKPVSAHPPVQERRCTQCHDPHGSAFQSNLVKSPGELCAGCHPGVAEAARSKVRHLPVQRGCTTCHEPHGSATAPSLLKSKVPDLCLSCHKPQHVVAAHTGYPMTTARCTMCHDPHGSPRESLLFATVHPPVARRNCAQCHLPATSARPFQVRASGVNLCKTCHVTRIAAMLDKSRVHWPVARGECLACHSPHASPSRGMLKANATVVCGACHADTVRRQEVSPTEHPPVRRGGCPVCHDPHGGETALLFRKRDPVALCGTCHDWSKHPAHPLGGRYVDPRNPNLPLDCLSCHRAHGTEYKRLLPARSALDMCKTCHERLRDMRSR